MAITNTEVIRFTNEQVRPLAEKMRALKVELDAMLVKWFDTIDALVPNDVNELLEDGRDLEGVSRLNGDDITGLLVVAQAVQATLETAGYTNRISKPCVRPLRASDT